MQAMLMAFNLDKCNTKLIILNISMNSQPRTLSDSVLQRLKHRIHESQCKAIILIKIINPFHVHVYPPQLLPPPLNHCKLPFA